MSDDEEQQEIEEDKHQHFLNEADKIDNRTEEGGSDNDPTSQKISDNKITIDPKKIQMKPVKIFSAKKDL